MSYLPIGSGGRGKLDRPAVSGKTVRAMDMLGAYWMKLQHQKAEREASGEARKAKKALDQTPDLSASSEQTLAGVVAWEREKVPEWISEGRINRYGLLTPSKRKPDRTTRLLYHLFKATGGTRRKEGLSRAQARSLQKFLYGDVERKTWDTSDRERFESTAEPAKEDSPPISEERPSETGPTSASGAETSKDTFPIRSPEQESEAPVETPSIKKELSAGPTGQPMAGRQAGETSEQNSQEGEEVK